jgi:hypothetical protein
MQIRDTYVILHRFLQEALNDGYPGYCREDYFQE